MIPRMMRAPPIEPPIIAAWWEGESDVDDEAVSESIGCSAVEEEEGMDEVEEVEEMEEVDEVVSEGVGCSVIEEEEGVGEAVANAPCPERIKEGEGCGDIQSGG